MMKRYKAKINYSYIKKSHLNSGLYTLKPFHDAYFLILPSPNMIQRAKKGELSSSIKAYFGSIFFMLPESH